MTHIKAVTDMHPNNIRAQTILAQTWMALDKPETARQVIKETEKKYGVSAELLELKVQIYLKQENEVGLRKTMLQIKELHASSVREMTDVLVRLAAYELQLGNNTRAFGVLEEASKLEPRVSVLVDLGALAEKLGDLSRARAIFKDIVEMDPNNAIADQALKRLGEPILPKAAAATLEQNAAENY
jgi:tetratricopeptide (TPR) repeat protein